MSERSSIASGGMHVCSEKSLDERVAIRIRELDREIIQVQWSGKAEPRGWTRPPMQPNRRQSKKEQDVSCSGTKQEERREQRSPLCFAPFVIYVSGLFQRFSFFIRWQPYAPSTLWP